MCFFGEVVDGEIQLFKSGEIVAEEWLKTEQIRENVKLDEWIIMPNHLHGIIIIENKNNVETHCNASLQRNNLSFIIRGFKSATTKRVHMMGYPNFAWQSRFYDHIIRNERSLQKIREYIVTNPLKWELDEYNPNNL